MSTDEKVAAQLVKTLENGRAGFEKAAEKLANSDRADLSSRFQAFSAERAAMSQELQTLAAAYGDDIDERGSVPGALHRGWLAVKDAMTGDDAEAVIAAAESGEDHALEVYRDALTDDVSPEFRVIIQRQLDKVQQAHDFVRSQVS